MRRRGGGFLSGGSGPRAEPTSTTRSECRAPRANGDPRGSFALLQDHDRDIRVTIERAVYDAQAVAMEIRDVGLPRELADQLVRAE
jgi:hypothetical protein